MLPGDSGAICMIYQMFPGLDLWSTIRTDPAQHVITNDTGTTVDHIDRIDDLCEVSLYCTPRTAVSSE